MKYPKREMISHARWRASCLGVPFDLTEDDFEIPTKCPFTGMRLYINHGSGGGRSDSATLDRIIPEKGYVRGNVQVISMIANQQKGDNS